MNLTRSGSLPVVLSLLILCSLAGPATLRSETQVPGQVQFAGRIEGLNLTAEGAEVKAGVRGVTFSLFAEQQGGAALWVESQNVAVTGDGAYSTLLGAETAGGIPQNIFASGAARWLEVSYTGADGVQVTQPRVLLVSVPYALKAGDAATLGGLPVSAFVLNTDAVASRVSDNGGLPGATVTDVLPSAAVTAGRIAKFNSALATDVVDSIITEASGKIGIGTTTPVGTIDVGGWASIPGDIQGVGSTISGDVFMGNTNGGIGRFRMASNALQGFFSWNQYYNGTNHKGMDATAPGWRVNIGGTGGEDAYYVERSPATAGGHVPARLFVVNGNGNVGISTGTAAPLGTLDVGGWPAIPNDIQGVGSTISGDVFMGNTNGGIGRYRMASNALQGFFSWNQYYNGTGHKGMDATAPGWRINVGGTGIEDAFYVERSPATAGLHAPSRLFQVSGSGNVGIGTIAPTAKLDVVGTVKTTGFQLVDGNQAANKVLTSDANGNASWQTPAGGGGGDITAVTAGTGLTGGAASGDVMLNFDTAYGDGRYARLGAANNLTGALSANVTTGTAVIGSSADSTMGSTGVQGISNAVSGLAYGGQFEAVSPAGVGVEGKATSTTGSTTGGRFFSFSTSGIGVQAGATAATGTTHGIYAESLSSGGTGVSGRAVAASGSTTGVHGLSASTTGTGVFGVATATSGTNFGGQFQSESISGSGVYGLASAATGTNFGGRFETSSIQGFAVHATATAPGGPTFGVIGRSSSTEGVGTSGVALATTGTNYGGYFQSLSSEGSGVYGLASAATGVNYGGRFETPSTGGYAVYGWGTAAGGAAIGVFGRSASTGGRGVVGWATASSGVNFGVLGQSDSPTGYGVYGHNLSPTGVSYGGYFESASAAGTGVRGIASSATGTNYGGFFETMSATGMAVNAKAAATSGVNFGGRFETMSTSGRGVVGIASANSGTTFGVVGESSSPTGYAMHGTALSSSGVNFGGFFTSLSSSGTGVRGYASAMTGTTFGVYGQSDSPTGYGVYSNGNMEANGAENDGTTAALRIVSGAQSMLLDGNEIDASGSLLLNNNSSGNVNLVNGGGSVGIGTSSPDQKLSVNGNASKTGGTSWAVFSDARLKEIDQHYTVGLDALIKLSPVLYRYKQDNPLGIADHKQQIGFVAQEVEQVIPEAVTMMPSGYRQLNADPILWTMLNAIKDLKAENDTLRAELAEKSSAQQTEISELREMLMSLHRQMGTQVSKAGSGQ